MAKRRFKTEADIDRFVKDGYGQGEGSSSSLGFVFRTSLRRDALGRLWAPKPAASTISCRILSMRVDLHPKLTHLAA